MLINSAEFYFVLYDTISSNLSHQNSLANYKT